MYAFRCPLKVEDGSHPIVKLRAHSSVIKMLLSIRKVALLSLYGMKAIFYDVNDVIG